MAILLYEIHKFNNVVLHDICAKLRKVNNIFHFLLQGFEGLERAPKEEDTQDDMED